MIIDSPSQSNDRYKSRWSVQSLIVLNSSEHFSEEIWSPVERESGRD